MRICWLDTETTGLDPIKNGLIQVAYIIEENGQIIGEDNVRIRPFVIDEINESALHTNHITKEQLEQYPDAYQMAKKLWNDLYEYTYINKEVDSKREHLWMAGHNVKFDYDFLDNFFQKANSYRKIYCPDELENFSIKCLFDFHLIDTFSVSNFLKYCGVDFGTSHKLSALCEKFQIPLNENDAHDAMNDINATFQLGQVFKNAFLRR